MSSTAGSNDHRSLDDAAEGKRRLGYHLLVVALLLGWPLLLRWFWTMPTLLAYGAGLVLLVARTKWSTIEKVMSLLIPVGIVYANLTWTASSSISPPDAYAGSPEADRIKATIAGAGVVLLTVWLGWRSFSIRSSSQRADRA